uniref:KH RNA binding domain containing, signal transduction associated 3 n=1 Tax=Chelonoidis abingdonii TaxID=106734 RepID=A0A8C0JBK7_CHEAB
MPFPLIQKVVKGKHQDRTKMIFDFHSLAKTAVLKCVLYILTLLFYYIFQEYDDGYGTAYDEQGYDSYDNSYSTQAQSGTDYYDYGHGLNEETYDSYGQEEWTNSRHKAPSARTTKGIYRDQPYARY